MTVRLRQVEHEDSARLLAWRNSPDVAAYMYTDHRISQAEHDRWFAAALTLEDRRYWIIEMDGQPVGLANLARIDPIIRRCDWAYYLGEASTRGRGVGAQVEYIVLRHVFETMGFHKLWCEVLLENEAVWKLHESFGFKREACYREHVCKGGRFQDVVGLGMLKADWEAAKPAIEAKLRERGIEPASLADAP
ncbi:UDP-4-amino-4,6-dideoxy-N-acetyl-beta-L-altrosamine N-acetyltransferase [Phenylobacterium sp.]|uniref:UDP-4-amino-4, 6-dideoxy-N-acetyl-beta-L-altrosamine N-acetyltransferase n=1 Tax=Phenylobacterium sp. TaxID=1871053 RepID=UPI002811ADC2|nr:UDP-4-amino-4,6-dideoxy-N-acetyl-beta-L-altrosamine N-acetyltransferase [Phenylobacterium sp.]